MRLIGSILSIALAAGCATGNEAGRSQAVGDSPTVPLYGPVVAMAGIVEDGPGLSKISICADSTCRKITTGGRPCWFTETQEFSAQVFRSSNSQAARPGNPRWRILFRGRVAYGGRFGRRNAYRCQVEAQVLSSMHGWPRDS